MLEAPLFWGGDAAVRATVVLGGASGPAVDLPIDVANVQLKALARITIRPLVEQLPCVGGVTLSLLVRDWGGWLGLVWGFGVGGVGGGWFRLRLRLERARSKRPQN